MGVDKGGGELCPPWVLKFTIFIANFIKKRLLS